MYYPDHIIEQVREDSDIISIISEYTHLTKRGNGYVGLCPFHHEKTPSFSVSEEKQMYYCFGCGAGGNTITFLMEKENMNFVEAVAFLADKLHIDLSVIESTPEANSLQNKKNILLEIHRESAKFFYYHLSKQAPEELVAYLNERKLTDSVIKQFGIGYAPAAYNSLYLHLKSKGFEDAILLESGLILKGKTNGNLYDRFHNRLIFPIFHANKKVIAFGGRALQADQMPKYLNSPESLLFHKSNTLYGLHLAKANKHANYILVEGYMDVIAMHKAGFSQTVASLGTAFTPGHAKLLKRYTNAVTILYDSDQAGINATMRAIPILLEAGLEVKVLHLEQGKDPDEYLAKEGPEKMQQLLNSALSHVWFKIQILEGNFDVQDAGQKITFLKEVAQIIATLESNIEQNIYTKEVSLRYQVDKSAIDSEVKKFHYKELQKSSNKVIPTPTIYKEQDNDKKMQAAFLSTLYHYPTVYRTIKEYIEPHLFMEGVLQEISRQLIHFLETGEEIDIVKLQSQYADIGDQRILSTVFMNHDVRYEEDGTLKKMLTDTIKRLNITYIEKQLKYSTDIKEVQNLLIRKKVLDKLYIDTING